MHKQQIPGQKIMLLFFSYLIKYFSYGLLTYSVLFMFISSAIFIISIGGGNTVFEFLRYLEFLNPIYAKEAYSLGPAELLQIYSFVSLAVWFFVFLIKAGLEAVLKKPIKTDITIKIKSGILALTVFLVIDILTLILLMPDLSDKWFGYILFILTYIFAGVAFAAYCLLQALSNKLLSS